MQALCACHHTCTTPEHYSVQPGDNGLGARRCSEVSEEAAQCRHPGRTRSSLSCAHRVRLAPNPIYAGQLEGVGGAA